MPAIDVVGFLLNVMLTLSLEGVHGEFDIVHLRTYAVPAVPVKVDVGLVGVAIVPPAPDTMVHNPVPTKGVLAASVTVVKPQLAASV